MRDLMEIRDVIAHPGHGAAQLMLQPDSAPLGRPMMGVPDLVLRPDCCRKPHHVQIPTEHARFAKPGQTSPAHIDDRDVLADLWKAVGCVIRRSIKDYLVALTSQFARETDALPFTAAFHQQLMHD